MKTNNKQFEPFPKLVTKVTLFQPYQKWHGYVDDGTVMLMTSVG